MGEHISHFLYQGFIILFFITGLTIFFRFNESTTELFAIMQDKIDDDQNDFARSGYRNTEDLDVNLVQGSELLVEMQEYLENRRYLGGSLSSESTLIEDDFQIEVYEGSPKRLTPNIKANTLYKATYVLNNRGKLLKRVYTSIN